MESAPQRITLPKPDDFHHHLRDGPALADTVAACAGQFGRALCMPNLAPPVTTAEMAKAYKMRILEAHVARGGDVDSFQPLMTIYLTDNTSPEDVKAAAAAGDVKAFKLYPAGATTNSASGVTDYAKITPALSALAQYGLPLCVHGEVTDAATDIFDRERVFVERRLPDLLQRCGSGLKVVLEHMTTKEAADVVLSGTYSNLAGTITPQHLLANRNHMLAGGIRPHFYCLPILKTEEDRQALLYAAASGCERIFLGTDSAPHAKGMKETACGCAGVFTSHAALEFYAEAFEEAGALDKLPNFAAKFGAAFYGLPPPTGEVTLVRQEWTLPEAVPFGDTVVVPFRAGGTSRWRIEGKAPGVGVACEGKPSRVVCPPCRKPPSA